MSPEANPRKGRETYRLTDLVHRYERKTVLEVGFLDIGQGTIMGLVGPNGSGKSTLLRILALVEKPTQGQIRFQGNIADFESARYRRSVTLLLQDPYLLKRSVFENVAYGLKVRSDIAGLKDRVAEALNLVGLDPDDFMDRSHRQLSGGEAQRVALAARLILKPQVLLLDEPTASVDSPSALRIREAALRARQEWGTTLVIASHDRAWLEEVADKTIHLYEGRIIRTGLLNLLTGPWLESRDGSARKELGNGNRIVSVTYKGTASAATIDPGAITLHLHRPQSDPGLNILKGRLNRLGLTNGDGNVLTGIAVGSVVLTARMDLETTRRLALVPGQEVWLSFNRDSVEWL